MTATTMPRTIPSAIDAMVSQTVTHRPSRTVLSNRYCRTTDHWTLSLPAIE